MDSTASRPTPGQVNTASVTTAPSMMPPTWSPMIVTTGMRAFLRAWMKTTRRIDAPLALAVRMKSRLSTSIIEERVKRMLIAAPAVPKAIAGSTMCRRFS